ncbi:Vacuolar segregation protein 7 [Cytospora mali]|uniref:Vacuolar segregation protein 7 n=1 Tax=Cytospora mali TaxID=578113 RepID=A0A194V9P0_CYTMA|nr:Vacuolar segregation protein 7 [Valsa mali var. pyri (nom. inval.)]
MDTTTNYATGPTDANANTTVPARPSREPSNASTIKGDINSPPSQPATQTSASQSSPLPSRETSPNRPLNRSSPSKPASTAGSTRSRNTSQDTSPSRTPKHTLPSAPTSGKISATTTPNLGPVPADATVNVAAPHKSPVTAEHLKEGPRWPVSPRLRSPPPAAVLNRPSLPPPRKGELEPPSIHVQRSSPPVAQQPESSQSDNDGEELHLQPGMRTPARGASGSSTTLETVQEASPLATPQDDDAASEKVDELTASEAGSQADHFEYPVLKTAKSSVAASNNDSGSDSGSVRGNRRVPLTSVPPPMTSRQSSMSNKKTKPSEGSVQHMTVETETVTSIPQHSLAPVALKEGVNGTLRTKQSSETIRPKKEKKKTSRKHPNVGSGTGETLHLSSAIHAPRLRHHQSMRSVSSMTDALISPTKPCAQSTYDDDVVVKSEALSPRRNPSPNSRNYSLNNMSGLLIKSRVASSKADIFEAKIATAVDEADTSDSDETFVYDSNPPDASDRPRRFHSRTPSATSMASQIDRNGLRSFNIMENPGPSAGFKRNMKFVNTLPSSGSEMVMADEDGNGSARSNAGSARGTGRVHHHHFGRWGRSGTNGHTSLFDNEAPFHLTNTTAQRAKFSTNSSRVSSGPPSPRFLNAGRLNATGKRGMHSASYDLDETGGADDERTPLIHGSVRSSRSGRARRGPPVSLQSLESQNYRRNPSVLNRFASCLVLTVMLLLVVSGAIGFMFATSQPLMDVQLTAIKSVVAAEQELIFDITVKAYNPNVVIITVDQADIEVFAKSPHAGTDSEWWKRPKGHDHDSKWDSGDNEIHTAQQNEGPVDDKAPNMRLGTISKLDNALSFEGSFFNSGMSESSGEVKLRAPGNGTTGGPDRWERILQDEFDLIIKGVLKYSLPLSQRVRSTAISGRTTVKPNSANDPTGNGTQPITDPRAPE